MAESIDKGGDSPSKESRGKEGNGGYGRLSGNELDTAAEDSSAGWGQPDYADQVGSGGFDTAFGWDSPREIAKGMAGLGFSDRDISEALSNWGTGYIDRASLVGPIDAITQGDFTRALSGALSIGLAQSSPMAGLLGQVADQYQRGSLTGSYSGLGGLLGGLVGSRFGGEIGADLGGTMQAALGGVALGGLGGTMLGRAIGSGQGTMTESSGMQDVTGGERKGSTLGGFGTVRQAMQQPQQTTYYEPANYGWYA